MPRPVHRTSPLITAWLAVLLSCAALAAAPGSGAARAAVQPGDDWPLTRGSPARTAAAGVPGGPGGPATVVWRYRLPGEGDSQVAPPVVAGRSAFVLSGSRKGILSAVDVATGKHVWRSKAHYPLDTGLALVDDLVIAVEMEGFLTPPSSLVALDAADGGERWRFALGPVAYVSTPTVADGLVFVGTGVGDLIAIDAANGDERWRTRVADGFADDPENSSPSVSPAAVADGAVVVVAATLEDEGDRVRRPRPERPDPPAGDVLVSLDAATGAERWRAPLEGFAQATGPAIADGTVYVPVQSLEDEDSGYVLAVDGASGAERWRSTVEGSPDRPLAVGGDRVYLGLWSGSSERDTLVALETATGQEAWRVPEVGGAPVVAGDLVYAAGGKVRWGGTELVALDARSGDERWRLHGVGGRIALADGVVYALGQTNLYAVAEGSPAATSGATSAADAAADADPILAWGDDFLEDEGPSSCAGDGAGSTDPLDGEARSAPHADAPGLWVVDPASGGLDNLTPGRESVAHPAWSPDGSRIAFLDGGGRIADRARRRRRRIER